MIARLPRNFATGWLAGLQPRWAKHLPRMSVLDQVGGGGGARRGHREDGSLAQ